MAERNRNQPQQQAAQPDVQVRRPETDPDSPEFDEKQAIETLRKIRRGSKRGGEISKRMFEIARQQLGPDWRAKADEMSDMDEDARQH